MLLNILQFQNFVFFFSYASLYFCCAIEQNDNELLTLEIIHRYVELLDKYFGSVSTNVHSIFIHDNHLQNYWVLLPLKIILNQLEFALLAAFSSFWKTYLKSCRN